MERRKIQRVRADNGFPSDSSVPRGVSALGDFIRLERVRKGMTQTELSQRTGLSQTVISAIEVGDRPGNLNTRKKIAEALGLDPAHMLVIAGDLERPPA